jgi:16S rRNA (uracil1498-N3)-methyltransferase
MSERFYTDQPLAEGTLLLTGAEAHHLATVCRVRPGEEVLLFNGDGCQYRAVVQKVVRRQVAMEIAGVERPQREVGFRVEVAAPLPKGDRGQFLVEKLTELGVTHFVPLRTARSVVLPRQTHLDKLRRYVIEASKQCGRNVLLQVEALTAWKEYASRTDLPAQRLVAHPEGEALLSLAPPLSGIVVAVGPEGGWTTEELDLARKGEWEVVSLGPRILRVETAALVLAARAVAGR